jgi:hypothetical protein
MIRDSPPELDRLLPAPYASNKMTDFPARRKCSAHQAPKAPAPITAASYVSDKLDSSSRFPCTLIDEACGCHVLYRHAERLEHIYLIFSLASEGGIRHQFAKLSHDNRNSSSSPPTEE